MQYSVGVPLLPWRIRCVVATWHCTAGQRLIGLAVRTDSNSLLYLLRLFNALYVIPIFELLRSHLFLLLALGSSKNKWVYTLRNAYLPFVKAILAAFLAWLIMMVQEISFISFLDNEVHHE